MRGDVGLVHTMMYLPVVFNTDTPDGTAMVGMGYRVSDGGGRVVEIRTMKA